MPRTFPPPPHIAMTLVGALSGRSGRRAVTERLATGAPAEWHGSPGSDDDSLDALRGSARHRTWTGTGLGSFAALFRLYRGDDFAWNRFFCLDIDEADDRPRRLAACNRRMNRDDREHGRKT